MNVYHESSHVLRDIAMRVKNGSPVSSLGRTGAGKTTTLKSVMRLVKAKRGEILDRLPNGRGKLGISLASEGRGLFPGVTVMDHLRLGYTGYEDTRSSESLHEEVFDLFLRLAEQRAQKVTIMSGGEQQMLAIA
jgi:branched-chain amino acid transport system ATP-binding protein